MSIRFFYWANAYDERLQPLLASAQICDIHAEPIGEGWPVRQIHHSLFKQKSLYDAVESLDRTDVVCVTDGFDAFFQQPASYVLDTFRALGNDVVFSAERNYAHQPARHKTHFDNNASGSPYRYLNAGGVIGYAWAIKQLYRPSLALRARVTVTRIPGLRRIRWWSSTLLHKLKRSSTPLRTGCGWLDYTDQQYMAQQLVFGRPGISMDLDRQSRLFWCTSREYDDIEDHYTLINGKLQNNHTGEVPAIVHVPSEIQRPVFERLHKTVYATRLHP